MGISIYGQMGVETQKGSIGKKFGGIITNEYPHAFCVIVHDKLALGFAKTMKFDGTGSKPTQRCLVFYETYDPSVFESDAEDCYAMVAGDAAASGLVSEHCLGDIIDINRFNTAKQAIVDAISVGFGRVIDLHRQCGFIVEFMGGETADLPSQVSSYVLNGAMTARGKISDVINGLTQPDDLIWGMSSAGQASWEEKPNSGLMCNAVTLACAVTMWEGYNLKYPFLRHERQKYRGRFKVGDKPDGLSGLGGMSIDEALLSPTRQWAIVIKMLIEELKANGAFHLLHGITMNTGGGSTKCLRLGEEIRYVKRMPAPPSLFQLIKNEGKVPWREMFEDCNCGVGLDIIGSKEGGYLDQAIRNVSERTGVQYFQLGECERSPTGKNDVVLETDYGTFDDYVK